MTEPDGFGISLSPGQPPPPIVSEKDLGRLAVKVADRLRIYPGPKPSIYAFARENVQRNLYRIPLP